MADVRSTYSSGWAVASSGNLFAWETVRTSSSIFHTIRPLPSPGQNDDPVNDATEIIGMLTVCVFLCFANLALIL